MTLVLIDWLIIAAFLVTVILIGIIVSRRAGKDSAEFFLGGRRMPWWLLGVSMVACTFSCDTPNLVTDMVRSGGVVKNWAWWAFLITGMVTVFIYAQLWRRSKVMTDLEFYELRYSGKSAAFIRGFRSLYLGILFNCLIMGSVTLAAIKIGQVIFDVEPWVAVVCGSIGVVIYATAGGIQSCIWADFFQYTIAMFGAVYAAIVACKQPEVGGLGNLLSHPDIVGKLSWMPDFSTWLAWVPLLVIPVAVQWWSVWYPGAEPGGGGYIAQRMLSAKDEKNAIGATLFFNFMHYAMRPWPWIIVALASIVCYPSLASIKDQFPGINPTYLKEDIAYPVMISKLGPGLLGLVVASLIAAYMSTIGTHLNWGASYVVNDFYKRFVQPDASEKTLVNVGRGCTIILMIIAGVMSLTILESAGQAFEIMLLSGAGTGAIYILRWFWWRINAWTEIIAMVAATVVAFGIVLGYGDDGVLKWYVGSSCVSERVFVVDDAEVAQDVSVMQEKLMEDVTAMQSEELEPLIDNWKKAGQEGVEARKAARALYDAKVAEIDRLKETASIMSLVRIAQVDEGTRAKLEEFYAAQKDWQVERENKRIERLNAKLDDSEKMPLKSSVDVSVGFDGVIKDGKVYLFNTVIKDLLFSVKLLVSVLVVTIVWLVTTFVTPAVDKKTLRSFYSLCHPGGPGWRKVVAEAKADGEDIDPKDAIGNWTLPMQVLCVFLGCVAIYSSLFAIGNFVYGNTGWGIGLAVVAAGATIVLFKSFNKIGVEGTN